jgi:hypothetical protein
MRCIQGTSQADSSMRTVGRVGLCGDARGRCPCMALCVKHPHGSSTHLYSGDASGHACRASGARPGLHVVVSRRGSHRGAAHAESRVAGRHGTQAHRCGRVGFDAARDARLGDFWRVCWGSLVGRWPSPGNCSRHRTTCQPCTSSAHRHKVPACDTLSRTACPVTRDIVGLPGALGPSLGPVWRWHRSCPWQGQKRRSCTRPVRAGHVRAGAFICVPRRKEVAK